MAERIEAVISDFGGVLTTPLVQSFAAVQDQTGIPMEELGKAMGAKVSFSWRPFLERGLTRQTFDAGMCDVMIDIPVPYGSLLTTMPMTVDVSR